MLNVLLGQGNDRLTITGTLDPATESYTPVTFTGAVDMAPTGGAGTWFTLTRVDGTNWATGTASDFIVGQQVMVSGIAGTFRVVAVAGDVLTLERLRRRAGAGRRRRTSSRRCRCPGRTAASRSSTAAATSRSQVDAQRRRRGDRPDAPRRALRGSTTATRSASGSRSTARPRPGRSPASRTSTCTLADPFARCGKGSRMLLSGATARSGDERQKVASSIRSRSSRRRDDARRDQRHAGDRLVAHRRVQVGMEVFISGLPGSWKIASISATR